MIDDMLQYYNLVKDEHISIIYSGPVWFDGLEGLGNTLRKKLEFEDMPFSSSQAVFSVFVEQMNNMCHYSADKRQSSQAENGKNLDAGAGIFILGSEGKKYFLQTGNMMKIIHKELIQSRIDYLNTLDKTEMRKYYKERMKAEDENEESKGAGIGLIEIARRASSKIEYKFTEIDDENTFFSMSVII